MNFRTVTFIFLMLTFSSVTYSFYFVVDYMMDHGWPKVFGQSCDDYVQNNCVYINSHLNTFGDFDYRGHVRCKMTLDAGEQANATYKLKWHRFKVEATDCSIDYDFLEFHDAPLSNYSNATRIGKYCGWTWPDPNLTDYVTGQYLTMVWRTNGAREDKGWRFMATRMLPYPCPSNDYFHCKAENKCMDGRLKCDGIEQCEDGEDEGECSTWEKIIGGFLALGTAGVTAVSCTCLVLCILAIIGAKCIYGCIKSKKNSQETIITVVAQSEEEKKDPPTKGSANKVAPGPEVETSDTPKSGENETVVKDKKEEVKRPVSAVSAASWSSKNAWD